MRQNELRKIIEYWAQWVVLQEPIERPDYKKPVLKKLAQAYIGVRRSGKTTLAFGGIKHLKGPKFYMNFEDPFFITNQDISVLDDLIEAYVDINKQEPRYLIFDEIQNIPHWERWVRKIIEANRYRVIITGSSAKLLSSEIATSLTGRSLSTEVWPLSFREFLLFSKKRAGTDNEKLAHLNSYLNWGGFPEITLTKTNRMKKEILRQYLTDIIHRDIVARHEIRHVHGLNQITQYLLKNISCLHSATKIKNAFDINVQTVQDYLQFLEDAYLFFQVSRYHPNLKQQTRDPKKNYCIDPGIRQANVVSQTDDTGALAENVVYLELRRRYQSIYYYKETQEVDFLCVEGIHPVQAIQVSFCDLENESTTRREIDALTNCLQNTNLKSGLLLTRNVSAKYTINGKTIICLPLFRWLLNPRPHH